jgi:hypothetical protein
MRGLQSALRKRPGEIISVYWETAIIGEVVRMGYRDNICVLAKGGAAAPTLEWRTAL